MSTTFFKYHGAGNDFILFDNRSSVVSLTPLAIAELCDRKFGIGADGLMLLEKAKVEGDQFYMTYFNSDGLQSSMCGNGGRCIALFAKDHPRIYPLITKLFLLYTHHNPHHNPHHKVPFLQLPT